MDLSDYSSMALALHFGTTSLYSVTGLAGFSIFLIIISILSIILRCWARYVSERQSFGLDDWFAIAALPLCLLTLAIVLVLLNHGLGKHIDELQSSEADFIFLNFYWGQLVWILGNAFIELSALAFYARIFNPRTNPDFLWKLFYWIVVGLTAAWTLAFLVSSEITVCQPINAFWDITQSATHCRDVYTTFLIGSIGKIIVEVLILLVPLPQVLKLVVPFRKKIEITIAFILGYAVAFISMGRIIVSLQIGGAINSDPTFFLIPYLYWDLAEIALSIVVICFPAFFQLFRRTKRDGVRSLFYKKSEYMRTNDTPQHHRINDHPNGSRRPCESGRDNLYGGSTFNTIVTAGPASIAAPSHSVGNTFALSAISVRREVQLEHTNTVL